MVIRRISAGVAVAVMTACASAPTVPDARLRAPVNVAEWVVRGSETLLQGDRDLQLAGSVITLPVLTRGPSPGVMDRINGELAAEALLGAPLDEIQAAFAQCRCGVVFTSYEVTTWPTPPVFQVAVVIERMTTHSELEREVLAFDAETGARIGADALFDRAQREALVAIVDAQVQASLVKAIARARAEGADDVAAELAGLRFTADHLGAFELRKEGIAFDWQAGLGHDSQALAPDGPYPLGWDEVAPFLATRYHSLAVR